MEVSFNNLWNYLPTKNNILIKKEVIKNAKNGNSYGKIFKCAYDD